MAQSQRASELLACHIRCYYLAAVIDEHIKAADCADSATLALIDLLRLEMGREEDQIRKLP